MNQTLTDRPALLRQRARALRTGPVDFLTAIAIDEVQERLVAVNRSFTKVAIIGGWMPGWAEAFPDATHVADTETLDLEVQSYDLVVHALCLHWAEDPVGQLVQARRALVPDGLLLVVAFGGRSLVELRAVLAEAEIALTGGLSPRVLPMAEIRDMGGSLQRAGLALPVADSLPLTVTYDTAFALMAELRGMGEGNALAARHKAPPPRALFVEAARRYAEAHTGSDGRISASFEMLFLTGWAPDESQPKPLRPGSAKMRLSQALGTTEKQISDMDTKPICDSAPRHSN